MSYKMADVTAASSGAPVLARARLKPDIYKTVDGKVIVEDELLHFLAIKIRTLSQDEIILLAANNFDSDWIEASKKMLFELCPTTQRNISHKGAQKDANNIKSCLKVLNECGDNVPRFVSHYLDELPPVTFTNMDVCGLFRKIEQLHTEVSAMKHALHRQTETSEGLRVVTADMNRRVSALEQHSDHGSAGFIAPVRRLDAGNASAAHATNSAVVGDPDGSAEGTETPDDRHRGEAQGPLPPTVESATPALGPGLTMSSPGSSMWSRVVKKGKQKRSEDYQQGSSTGKSVVGRKKAGKTIVGTGDAGDIKMITTKRVSVFATRFSPDIGAELLRAHLENKLGRGVSCERIVTVNSRYASFKISAECKDVGDMYNPELWPEGAYVRRFYEPRKVGVIANAATLSAGDMSVLATGNNA